jgi:hypothetical protein
MLFDVFVYVDGLAQRIRAKRRVGRKNKDGTEKQNRKIVSFNYIVIIFPENLFVNH